MKATINLIGRTGFGACLLVGGVSCASSERQVQSLPPPPVEKEEAADPTFGAEEAPKAEPVAAEAKASEPEPVVETKVEPFTELPVCASRDQKGDDKQPCYPPAEFTNRLCKGSYPGVSIAMFEKSAGWSRGYIRMEQVDSVNTLGGPASDAKLVFSEEVIVLRETGSGGGAMQVSNGKGFVVLRWDGTCATLDEHELVPWMPALPQHPPFVWGYIDTNIQKALLANQRIAKARGNQRKLCRGGRLNKRSDTCQKATGKLRESIVLAVRTGIQLPTPENLP